MRRLEPAATVTVMPYLVQILLPLRDNADGPFPRDHYGRVRSDLTERFGGLTAHTRAPAQGLWEKGSTVERDDIVIFEVMADALDRAWWAGYRRHLERLFRQDQIAVRAHAYEPL